MEATTESSVMEFLFNEELGLVVEVDDAKTAYEAVQVPACVMTKTQAANRVKVSVNGAVVLDEDEKALHDLWKATSFELDKLQSNPACAEQEQEGLKKRHKPTWLVKYRVAIIREEGSTLGVWVAHGEGRCFWSDDAVKEEVMRQNCVALKYVDDDGNVTMGYPMNPNGSEGAVVGQTSPIYRHL
ncbi:hypothetical protein WA577_001441 [Blastocystis sp. JDR]